MDGLDSFNLDQSRPLDGLVELLGTLLVSAILSYFRLPAMLSVGFMHSWQDVVKAVSPLSET